MSIDNEWRQMTFMDLVPEVWGEASEDPHRDESSSAAHDSEDSGSLSLMALVVERENCRAALRRVVSNRGSPGLDGMTVEELVIWLKDNWLGVKEQLLNGSYRPEAVQQTSIPKPTGGKRLLGIPIALDRFIQQAILQVLQPILDPTFSDHSYGYRPGRSAHGAVRRAARYVQEGRTVVVDVDLKSFFDRVNHDILMDRLSKRIQDRDLLRLIRRYLESGVMVNGVVRERHDGTPQGSPLSPLLANLFLDEVDKELEKRGHAFVRYADDGQVYVRSQRAAERAFALLRRLYGKLKLQVNEKKSSICSAFVCTYLGFSFVRKPQGRVGPRLARTTQQRFKARVRQITARRRGRSISEVITHLRYFLNGWYGYFRLADTPTVMGKLDGWVRRRLRALQLSQWKRGRTAYRELRKLGASELNAAQVAALCQRCWHASKGPIHYILNHSYFDRLGLPRLRKTST